MGDLDAAIRGFTEELIGASEGAVLRITPREANAQPTTPELLAKVRHKNKMRKLYQRPKDLAVKALVASLTSEIRR